MNILQWCTDFFQAVYNDTIDLLGIHGIMDVIKSGDYSSLRTLNGILTFISPLMPVLLLIELVRTVVQKKLKTEGYKISFVTLVFNRVLSRFISIAAIGFCIGLFQPFAILKTTFTWYWFIYGYIVWEFSHFIYHYFGHKVRLFWCLHSTHHAPENMNLSVSYAHFFLEAPYADFIRTSICILLGVNPPLLFLIMFVDGTWGSFIHIGEHMLKDGRLGFLNKIILTPSHHRVHHAKNVLYMDTNFCNLLNIWDKVFGTYQDEDKSIVIEYGITRPINAKNWLDVYFGELACLIRDVAHAPGLKNKLLYIVMPPGWSHTGNHKTSKAVKQQLLLAGKEKAMANSGATAGYAELVSEAD